MAKKEFAENKKGKVPFAVLRKGALCALVGTTALAGGLLVGCDENGSVSVPVGTEIYWGTENPLDTEGKVGDFYIETDDGDIWQLTAEGWKVISNMKGPQGAPGRPGVTPEIEISPDGYWVIDGIKTNKKALGETPEITISDDGYWEINGEKTDTKAEAEETVSVTNVTIAHGFDKDGNMYMDYTFHYSNDTTTEERVYPSQTIYVGTDMTLEKALEVVGVNGTIALKNDIVLNKVVAVNNTCTIDLAGRTISNTENLWNDTETTNDWSLISVREGGNLTITDTGIPYNPQNPVMEESEGAIIAKENDCFAIDVQDGAKCTINGGLFVGNISAVYVHTGELVVNDGTFAIQQLDPSTQDERYTLNCYNENYKNNTAKITVNAGYFVNFDPAQAGDDGNYVSSGNTSVSADMYGMSIYYVCPTEEAMEMLPTMVGTPVSMTLTEDIQLKDLGIVVGEGVDLTINLNGYTISAPNDEVGDGVFHVLTGGKLTIEGNGVVDAECVSEYKMAVWADGGEIVINGGTYTNSSTDGTDTQYDMIYASNGGIVTINGGTFDCKTPRWTLNAKDNSGSQIVVYGGEFKNYDPSFSQTENPPANFVAEDYTVISSEEDNNGDIWYTVVPGLNHLIANVEDGGTVVLENDFKLPEMGIVIDKEVTINLNGCTISAPNDEIGDGVFHVVAGAKLIIEGEGIIDAECISEYKMAIWADGGEVVINGGTYTNSSTDGTDTQYDLIYASNGGIITINGGTFDCKTPRWTLNQKDEKASTPETEAGTVIVRGGTFKNYDPSFSQTENPPANFVAEGYTITLSEEDANGDVWCTVVADAE